MNRDFIHTSLHLAEGPQQVALVRAAEEAAELTKEVCKALRFGVDNRFPSSDPTNAAKIRAEYEDLTQALHDAGVLRTKS